jgi:hypothetical protein
MNRSLTLRRATALALGAALVVVGAVPTMADDDAPRLPVAAEDAAPQVYVGDLSAKHLAQVRAAGLDHEDIAAAPTGPDGATTVEIIAPPVLAERFIASGMPLSRKEVAEDPSPSARTFAAESAEGAGGVFRPWSGEGNLEEEFRQVAADNPRLTELVTLGRSVQGQDILAVRVTRNAQRVPQGERPSVLYVSTQHAREWITPEMTRRLLHHVIDGYATDPEIRRLVDTTELWFVPMANPDGYDYTFTEGNRLWRKNLADNDGDGIITGLDGVDPNRNWPEKWGYDNEGSSPDVVSATYRGTGPASEPETQALDELMARIDFSFLVNYHSAAELILYGTGWQVATPTPDDIVYEALAGTDDNPAVPGYDPDLSAELYTTNGETTEHAHSVYGILGFTPEMSTCATASAWDPDDAFEPQDCQSVFNFPDSEPLIQREFEANIPFALAVAESAADPADPVSPVGIVAPDFVVDSFEVSYGSPQTVAVTVDRQLKLLLGWYRVNGGPKLPFLTREWDGGERYGDDSDVYYAERRGQIRARPGDSVEVWFSGLKLGESDPWRESERFTFTVAEDGSTRGDDVLVVANEDYEGVNPVYDPPLAGPQYLATYVEDLEATGARVSTWDISAQGVPHDLGVLSHFDAVVWYYGDNRITQDPEDELTDTFLFGPVPDISVAEREQFTTIAMRDYLNEGGKLLVTGETAGYDGLLGGPVGGLYYGLDGAPEEECVITTDFFSDCLILADDFYQYWLGAYDRQANESVSAVTGSDDPLAGFATGLDGTATNPLGEAGSFTVTSGVLPPEEFPQFADSRALGVYTAAGPDPYAPVEGEWYAGTTHADGLYTRLTRTVDLTGVAPGADAALTAQLSFDLETGYDSVLVEARTAGSDDWTTLPEAGGLSTRTVPTECERNFLLRQHPFLGNYLTLSGGACSPTGATGDWNALTGNSGGWQPVTFDLSAYAGSTVEVSIAYVTDPGTGGTGVFVDDTRVVVDGAEASAEGFETGLGDWTVTGPPPGSPGNTREFERSQGLVPPAQAAVATDSTVLFGFGIEQIADAEARRDLLGRTIGYLLDS